MCVVEKRVGFAEGVWWRNVCGREKGGVSGRSLVERKVGLAGVWWRHVSGGEKVGSVE